MSSPAVLAAETTRYGTLAEELKANFANIDDETLTDMLEGLSELPDLLKAIIRSSLLDEALAVGLKGRLGEMKDRMDRLIYRSSRKRELVCASMMRSRQLTVMAVAATCRLTPEPPPLWDREMRSGDTPDSRPAGVRHAHFPYEPM